MEHFKAIRRLKIRGRVRKRIYGTATRPRLSVYKSNTAIYAQLINDEQSHTLISSSSRQLDGRLGINIESAGKVGDAIAQQALAKGIVTIVFDRSGYIYHGRVKALAEGARAAGLKF